MKTLKRPTSYPIRFALSAATVLDGNTEAARLLAEVVHTEVGGETHPELENVREDVDADDLGIWIDPIGEGWTSAGGFGG